MRVETVTVHEDGTITAWTEQGEQVVRWGGRLWADVEEAIRQEAGLGLVIEYEVRASRRTVIAP